MRKFLKEYWKIFVVSFVTSIVVSRITLWVLEALGY